MSIINAGLEEYRNAFFALNEKLVAKQLVMEVKAIGGYAMLYNHLREGGFTVDVDTATKDYSPEIKELTEELMLDPEFKREYESLQLDMDNIRVLLDAEINSEKTAHRAVFLTPNPPLPQHKSVMH